MAMAKKPPSQTKRKRKQKRSDADYISSANKLASLVPEFKKLSRRKKLSAAEKSVITRREKQLKGIPNIFPVDARTAKKLTKDQLFAPGIRGVQLRNVSPNAKIKFKGKDIEVTDNGHRWIYWHLSRKTVRSRRGMRDAGRLAFEQQFPIERLSDLAADAFKRYNVLQVNLWAHAGIVGDPHHSINQFTQWVNEKWNAGRYTRTSEFGGNSDPGRWVNGIAILLEPKEYTERRERLKRENANVIAEMERKGREFQAFDKKRRENAARKIAKATAEKKAKRKPTKKGKRK